jgi:hypothetical protein
MSVNVIINRPIYGGKATKFTLHWRDNALLFNNIYRYTWLVRSPDFINAPPPIAPFLIRAVKEKLYFHLSPYVFFCASTLITLIVASYLLAISVLRL